MIRVASAQGYWGDWPAAPGLQVRSGPIDYLVFDYLAEVTMSILQKQRRRDPERGYAFDFVDCIEELLPGLLSKNIRVLSNAGGANPLGCARELLRRVRAKHPGARFKIGVVHGDDILASLGSLPLDRLDRAAPPLEDIRSSLLSANVYFGAQPMVEALRAGCQMVITGRVTDTGLTLAPMIHEFGVAADDWDALATGIVAGHILECGAQSSGGNFLGRRLRNTELVDLGFPIAEFSSPREFTITKHESLDGEVSTGTVKEQLLYEIGDPAEYITPDVVVDFRSISVSPDGPDRVRVHGVKGRPATSSYKVSCSYADGFMLTGTMIYTWPDAVGKARQAGELVLERARRMGISLDETRIETIGHDACHGAITRAAGAKSSEVQLRIAVRGRDTEQLERFGRDIVPLVLTGPPGATGFAGGRPRPAEVLAYWPGLIEKRHVTPKVEFLDETTTL
ncbi:DUF1446 domain-containing protein [Candidatus Poribacteria bacterium]|nr:DUF1446 domain-containing protein [Candidatus Poribacteria bacterium]